MHSAAFCNRHVGMNMDRGCFAGVDFFGPCFLSFKWSGPFQEDPMMERRKRGRSSLGERMVVVWSKTVIR